MKELDQYFIYKCEKGLVERGLADRPEYQERLKFEINTILDMGFPGYFLIVQEFINWAKDNNIYVGPGRGCLTGSTPVFLEDGTCIPLSKVKVGDRVYTHTGQPETVTDTHKYPVTETLLQINTFYGDYQGITLTKDHIVFGQKHNTTKRWENLNENTRTKIKKFEKPNIDIKEIKASNLEINDWLFIPKLDRVINTPPDYIDLQGEASVSKYLTTETDNGVLLQYIPVDTPYKFSIRDVARHARVSRGFVSKLANGLIDYTKSITLKQSKAFTKVQDYLSQQFDSIEDWKLFYNKNKFVCQTIARKIKFDNKLLWILGKWTADGWFNSSKNNTWGICFDSHEVEQIQNTRQWLEDNHIKFKTYSHQTQRLVQIESNCPILSAWWKRLFCQYRYTSQSKHLPKFVFSLPASMLKIVIQGYIDGHQSRHKQTATTVSYTLAQQIRFCLMSLGIPSSLQRDVRKDSRPGFINTQPSFVINFPKNDYQLSYNWHNNHLGTWVKIRDIKEINNIKEVFDLTVNADSSYLTSTSVVHNSAAGSLASYCLRITNLDPIKWDLLFERFLNPDRKGTPNITTTELPIEEFNKKILPSIGRDIDIAYY